MTPLDHAHAAMQAAENSDTADAARLHYYQHLADGELFVLLTQEATGETISPELFDLDQGRFVLAFDQQERLAAFSGQVSPYAAISGRVLAQMLDGQGIGLGVNIDVAPSSYLIPPEAIGWLNQTLAQTPDAVAARIDHFSAPLDPPAILLPALEAKLANAGGLVQAAYLVDVAYQGGGRGALLGFVGAPEPAQEALAKAVSEALTFAGIGAGAVDVGFFAFDDSRAGKLAAHGRKLYLPPPPEPSEHSRAVPGSDPAKPPILR